VGFVSGDGAWAQGLIARDGMHRLASPFSANGATRFEGVVLCRPDGYVARAIRKSDGLGSYALPTLAQLAG
jgi:hypothetical protein